MFEISEKTIEPLTVAFLAMLGDYAQIPKGYETLYSEITSRGLNPAGPPMSVYLSNPAETPEDEAVYELWAPIAGPLAPQGPNEIGFGVKEVPATHVAFAMHVGAYDDVSSTYELLMEWVIENGKQIAGPPMEVYFSDPEKVPESEYQTEVRIPIA